MVLGKKFAGFVRLFVLRDSDQHQALVLQFAIQSRQHEHLLSARGAPRSPEIHQHGLSAKRSQVHFISVQRFQLERGSRSSGEARIHEVRCQRIDQSGIGQRVELEQ